MKSKMLCGIGLFCMILMVSPKLHAKIEYIDSVEIDDKSNHSLFSLEDFTNVDRNGVSRGDFQIT